MTYNSIEFPLLYIDPLQGEGAADGGGWVVVEGAAPPISCL